jgi:putative spermidine/putrescine transport system ATP-binding protein
LTAIHRKVGTTFIYVTHDQEEALSMSDRVVIMNHGRVVQVGAPVELYERPASVFAADFLGKSNFLRATVVEAGDAGLVCELAGHRFRQDPAGHHYDAGAAVTLALRPEKITISAERDAGNGNVLPGEVANVTYLGSVLEVEVETAAAGRLVAQLYAWRNTTPLEPGQPVQLEWTADAAVVVSEDEA